MSEQFDVKVVIIVAGGGAVGKTTTTKAFAQGEPEEHSEKKIVQLRKGEREMNCKWTIYDNCAVAGNHHSGTDANSSPDLVRASLHECMAVRDISIVDGFTSSPQWVKAVNTGLEMFDGELHILSVHFDISAEVMIERLAGRRGVTVESIHERMWVRCQGLVKRAQGMKDRIPGWMDDEVGLTEMTVTADMDTETIVAMMDTNLEAIFESYGVDYWDI